MRTTRLFIDHPLRIGDEQALDKAQHHYLTRVLRCSDGTELKLFNGDALEYSGTLRCQGKVAFVQITAADKTHRESSLNIHLKQALLNRDKMDWVIQKAVELGVSEITPVVTQYSQKALKSEQLERRYDHWRGVVISAAQQSGRCVLPMIHAPVAIEACLEPSQDTALVLDPRAATSLRDCKNISSSCSLYIGPEGGFSEQEQHGLLNAGCNAIQLGPRILRTETAALATIASLQSLFGDC